MKAKIIRRKKTLTTVRSAISSSKSEKFDENFSFEDDANFPLKSPSYNKALATDEYKEIDSELAHEYFNYFHIMANNLDAADSWYETSCNSHDYEDCEGDRLLNWKDKGFITVFDLLQVFPQ